MKCQLLRVLPANAASACIGKSTASVITGRKTRTRNGILHPRNQNILLDIGLWLHDASHLYDTDGFNAWV